ncbi:uncharacterized protein LOC123317015 [Coccinella septempunctata]|uniref:uncharacterized protein LOC123317015 n=1 Tax=Coccinella septempunctata TaxID=41139 RepID=UPI001D08EF4D|nr:uncharacterized protein LOC123317015 [Coccinella septempunctata]
MYKNESNDSLDICSECFGITGENLDTEINEVYTVCSFCIDDPIGECTFANPNSVSVLCIKCGKRDDNNCCDFCLENRSDRTNRDGSKKEKYPAKRSPYFKEKRAEKSPYTLDQLEKIKKMTPAEKRDASCRKCGLMFHKSNTCVNTERFCFYCHKKGHEKKDCRKLKDQKSKN